MVGEVIKVCKPNRLPVVMLRGIKTKKQKTSESQRGNFHIKWCETQVGLYLPRQIQDNLFCINILQNFIVKL